MNDLVAVDPTETIFHTYAETAEDPSKLVGYIPVFGNSFNTAKAFGTGDWAGGLLGLAGTGLAAAGAIIDPFGTLLSSVASFLMDYMPPLPQMLDVLAGNPALVQGIGETWGNISNALTEKASAAKAELSRMMGVWKGAAAEAYKARMEMLIAGTAALSGAALGIGKGFAVASAIVEAVRTIVREIIAELVSRLIVYAAEVAATLGLATPVVVTQATVAIGKTVTKCAKWSDELGDAIRAGLNISKSLTDVLGHISKLLAGLGDGLSRGTGAWDAVG